MELRFGWEKNWIIIEKEKKGMQGSVDPDLLSHLPA